MISPRYDRDNREYFDTNCLKTIIKDLNGKWVHADTFKGACDEKQ